MVNITNNSPGTRIINVRKGKDKIVGVPLRSGETRDLDYEETPMMEARFESGELSIEKKKKDDRLTDAQLEAMAPVDLVAKANELKISKADEMSKPKLIEAIKKAQS